MILKFPNLDTLRLALTSGAIPSAVSQSAATVGFDDQNQVWVESAAPLPRAIQNDLRRLGVQLCKTSDAALTVPVRCWPEILPLQRDPDPLDHLEQTPILFETAGQDDLGRLVVEILRLGNDRQQFRWLESKTGDGDGRGLLRVAGPPYYSLLRAIDRNGQAAPRAYRERARASGSRSAGSTRWPTTSSRRRASCCWSPSRGSGRYWTRHRSAMCTR